MCFVRLSTALLPHLRSLSVPTKPRLLHANQSRSSATRTLVPTLHVYQTVETNPNTLQSTLATTSLAAWLSLIPDLFGYYSGGCNDLLALNGYDTIHICIGTSTDRKKIKKHNTINITQHYAKIAVKIQIYRPYCQTRMASCLLRSIWSNPTLEVP